VTHLLHLDVVQLEHIDVICLESLEAPVERETHVIAIELLRQLALATTRGLRGMIVDVVPNLRRIQHLVPLSAKSTRELPLPATVAVGVGSVEKADAAFRVRDAQSLHRFVVGFLAPPPGRERPRAKAYFAGGD